MNYSNTATPVSPSDVSLKEYLLDTDITLVWSYAGLDSAFTMARVLIVNASAPGHTLTFAPGEQGALGYGSVVTNTGANDFTVADTIGGTITVVPAGQTKLIELKDVSTLPGSWLVITLGATTSAADAAALAGFGLTPITTTLNVNIPGHNVSATQSFGAGDRASFIVWTGGSGVANFALSSTLTNGWWMGFRNEGTGTLTMTPTSPDLINGTSTEVLNINDSCLLLCTGAALYTVGIGRNIVVTDSQLVKNVTGGSDVTLTPSEYSNNIIRFIGTLSANINVIFPTAIKNYFLSNATTGAFSLTAKTASGTGTLITQGGALIVTVDGTNLNTAVSTSAGTVTSVTAGTGLNGGVISTTGTISIANTGVTAGTYGDANNAPTIVVNAQGQVTSISVTPTTFAPLASPAFTGTPTAPTAAVGTNTTQLATTAFVQGANIYSFGRLTLSSGVPVPTADIASSSTVYFTPYQGNTISLYTGSAWSARTFSEITITLSGLTSGLNYDLFAYDNSGVVTFDAPLAWTNDTTRATNIVLLNGVWVKSGDPTRRYIGSLRAIGTTTTCDTEAQRLLYNVFGQVSRAIRRKETAGSWGYSTATFRIANGNSANCIQILDGLGTTAPSVSLIVACSNGSAALVSAIIALDSLVGPAGSYATYGLDQIQSAGGTSQLVSGWNGLVGLGFHALNWLEISQATPTTTWYGTTTPAGSISEPQAGGMSGVITM